jgi:hypothetical protein
MAELAAAVSLLFMLASIPRRPLVFFKGQAVDQQHGASIISRYSFSWVFPVLRLAKSRPLTLHDLPSVDHEIRARTVVAKFSGKKGTERFWKLMLRSHAHILSFSWLLVFFKALFGFFAQISLHRFLQRLETGLDTGIAEKEAWRWVMALSCSLLAEAVVETWFKWVSEMRLEMPIIAFITAIVLQKTTRRLISYEPQNARPKSSSGKRNNYQHGKSVINLITGDR